MTKLSPHSMSGMLNESSDENGQVDIDILTEKINSYFGEPDE